MVGTQQLQEVTKRRPGRGQEAARRRPGVDLCECSTDYATRNQLVSKSVEQLTQIDLEVNSIPAGSTAPESDAIQSGSESVEQLSQIGQVSESVELLSKTHASENV